MISSPQLQLRRAERVRKVIVRAMGAYVFVPWLLSIGLWMIAVILVMRTADPNLDVNGWPFILRAAPLVTLLSAATLYVLYALHVRLMLQRKGPDRAIRYLFPEALMGTESWLDRLGYRAVGMSNLITQARLRTRGD